MEHLTGPTAGEAHQVSELTGDRAAGVDVEAGLPLPGQGGHPPGADPLGGSGDIADPQRVVARDPGVQPELTGRLEEDRSPAAPAPGQFDAVPAQRGGIHQLRRLRTAEDQRRVRDLTGQGQPTGLGSEPLDLEEWL